MMSVAASVVILILGLIGIIVNIWWQVRDARKDPDHYDNRKDRWSSRVGGMTFSIIIATIFFALVPPLLLILLGLGAVCAVLTYGPEFIWTHLVLRFTEQK